MLHRIIIIAFKLHVDVLGGGGGASKHNFLDLELKYISVLNFCISKEASILKLVLFGS